MSHFVGYFFGDTEKMDKLLAPYNENLEVEPYVKYTKAEVIEDFKKRLEEYPSNKEYYHIDNDVETYTDEELHKKYVNHSGYEFDEDGNELSTYNPKSKWDWYEIGGRWGCELHEKDCEDLLGVNESIVSKIDWDKTMIPFCFIDKEGNWHEKGEMWYWCITDNEKTNEDWEREFKDYIATLEDDCPITLIDFHI